MGLDVGVPDVLARAGSLRAAYDAVDWAATSLGPVAEWSPALRNAADLALGTRFPVTLFWGPEFVLVYNAAYVEMIADKHPAALGSPAREVFPEAWHQIGPMMEGVYDGQGAVWVVDELVPLHRSGFLENCWFTFSYSPVRGPGGVIEGVMDIAVETTTPVVVSRRLQLLTRLGAALAEVTDMDGLRGAVVEVLATESDDLDAADLVDGEDAGGDGWVRVSLPVTVERLDTPWLRVLPSAGVRRDAGFSDFLDLVAAALGRTADRLLATEAERSFSTALQVSLLPRPVTVPGIEVAVRYLPATAVAQVGGDWYDAFLLPDGSLTVSVGDVAGHDQHAAAAMAQLRNLARGVAYTLTASPASVLAGVDRAIEGLAPGVVATAVLVAFEDVGSGRPRARWSNAGHPPPVLIDPDGRARLLETEPELLLGLEPGARRSDHTVELESGSTLLLYTDGLVERRGATLRDGLDWLVAAATGPDLTPDLLCSRLLEDVAGAIEDDVALLALRVE